MIREEIYGIFYVIRFTLNVARLHVKQKEIQNEKRFSDCDETVCFVFTLSISDNFNGFALKEKVHDV